jgi:FAD/FMN-containing dehydrogenase
LIVGSLGTLAVIVQATLRCRPVPAIATWATVADEPATVRRRVFAPSTLLWDGSHTHLLLEGDGRDVDVQLAATGAAQTQRGPAWPGGAHRGRISVPPGAVLELGRALDAIARCHWIAEAGVGTVHVATDEAAGLHAAREAAHALGGWLLREAGGGDGFDGFGQPMPDREIARRLKDAFDPTGKLSPGRIAL